MKSSYLKIECRGISIKRLHEVKNNLKRCGLVFQFEQYKKPVGDN